MGIDQVSAKPVLLVHKCLEKPKTNIFSIVSIFKIYFGHESVVWGILLNNCCHSKDEQMLLPTIKAADILTIGLDDRW
jgi:hypothetical protein